MFLAIFSYFVKLYLYSLLVDVLGNRVLENLWGFIEMLKLDVAFLYDLLGASQEHSIKPKKFSQTDIDVVF